MMRVSFMRGAHHKAGNARARYLLVEAGWRILRAKGDETAALRAWALGVAVRRGKTHRGRRARAPACGHSVGDVARPARVRRDAPAPATSARRVSRDHEDRDGIG
jgi:hypothetical protein